MFRRVKIAAIVAVTVLCVFTDFGLNALFDVSLISHRARSTRTTRSARNDSEHELATHEPEHGGGVREIASGQGLIFENVADTPAGDSAIDLPVRIDLAPPGTTLDPVAPMAAAARLRNPVSPRSGRAPPTA